MATHLGLEWTDEVAAIAEGGERVTHLYPDLNYYGHLSIYHFALQFIQDAVVLDAGSGSGYGAAYLAEHNARFVHGIDVSENGIAFSQKHFQRPNLAYQVMDLANITGFEPASFDLIFSSNVLEHVPHVERFFPAAWRLLKPEGMFLLAVPPVPPVEGPAQNLANPYHLNIWSQVQWFHMLSLYFSEVQYYQHLPQEPVTSEKDFVFKPHPYQGILYAPTHCATFLARNPRPANEIPAADAPITYVDNSFTLQPGDDAMRTQKAHEIIQICQHALEYLEEFIEKKPADVAQIVGAEAIALPQSANHAIQAERERYMLELERSIERKNNHILQLESLLRRIENSRMMRILRLIKRSAAK